MKVVNIESKKNDYKKNLKTLKKLYFSIELAGRGNPPPRKMMAVWASLAAGLICFLLWHFIKPMPFYFNIYTVFIFIGIVYFLSYKMNSKSDLWAKEIDKLLSMYDPIDKDSYIELQSHTRDFGIDIDYISDWILKEKSIIYRRLGKKQHVNFINRKI
ncbi:hypothetical protein QVI09_004410 [Salmonella enterica]|nr:hypothetical protein [Salmonella enterica]